MQARVHRDAIYPINRSFCESQVLFKAMTTGFRIFLFYVTSSRPVVLKFITLTLLTITRAINKIVRNEEETKIKILFFGDRS